MVFRSSGLKSFSSSQAFLTLANVAALYDASIVSVRRNQSGPEVETLTLIALPRKTVPRQGVLISGVVSLDVTNSAYELSERICSVLRLLLNADYLQELR
jgi:hypothetical protein